jgi:signal transduction histidine kinase
VAVGGTRTLAGVAALVGLLLVVGVAAAVGLPRQDLALVVGIAGGAALVTGALGAAALRLLRGRSFTAQVVVVALTSTSAVTAGALAGGNAMFFDAHDLQVLAVVVVVGAVVSVVAALLLGSRVGAASRSLGEVARRLADVDGVGGLPREDDEEMPEALISEFARLAEQLERTRRELEESRGRERAVEQARRDLVTWVSHDLRTPLSGIRAITELLEDGIVEDPAEVRGYLTTLRRESDALAALVQDLFEVSRIEAGAIAIDAVPVDLAELVDAVVAAAAPVGARRGIEVAARVEQAPAVVEAGAAELERVLRNLVANAVRESADGGRVLVEAGLRGGEGWLAVTDTCGGIPPDVIGRVFEAAYRGEAARTRRADGGGGLGLAIARGLVQAHGGAIEVGNVEGGCRFTVTVPAGGAPPGSAGPPGPAPA